MAVFAVGGCAEVVDASVSGAVSAGVEVDVDELLCVLGAVSTVDVVVVAGVVGADALLVSVFEHGGELIGYLGPWTYP